MSVISHITTYGITLKTPDPSRVLAIDHVTTLRRALARLGVPDPLGTDVLAFKRSVMDGVFDLLSGVIVDAPLAALTRDNYPGLKRFLKVESGWRPWTTEPKWRLTTLLKSIHDWVERTRPDGLKLMIYFRPDAPHDVRSHQAALAAAVGEISMEQGLSLIHI